MSQAQSKTESAKPVTEEQDAKALQSNKGMDAAKVAAAHEEAEHDMEQDAELTATSPNDDLDEGETARLGEGPNDLI